MVRYIDPEDEDSSRVRERKSTGERIRAARERNAALSGDTAYSAAREAALRLLDRRAYSSGEIANKLAEKGFVAEAISAVVARLVEVSLIDDDAYARAFIRSRFDERGLVGLALRQELARKAVPDAMIERLLKEELGGDSGRDVKARALELARKKWAASPPERAYARTSAYLARRGYSPGVITDVLARVNEG